MKKKHIVKTNFQEWFLTTPWYYSYVVEFGSSGMFNQIDDKYVSELVQHIYELYVKHKSYMVDLSNDSMDVVINTDLTKPMVIEEF